MKTIFFARIGAALMSVMIGTTAVFANEDSLVTAVYSTVRNGYSRTKLPDGTFKHETYALANGGYSPGLGRDKSIDDIQFPAIAGLVSQHLAKRNYDLAQDSKSAELLLVVSWGKTIPFDDGVVRNSQDQAFAAMNRVKMTTPVGAQSRSADGIQSPAQSINDAAKSELEGSLLELQLFDSMRKQADERNAQKLGYSKEILSRNDTSRFAGAGDYYNELISDIESERYYVIIDAYDFHAATQEKQKKLLWSTRVSIASQGNRFNERLVAMMNNASRLFGKESDRLIRQYQVAPRVHLKELQILGYDEPVKTK